MGVNFESYVLLRNDHYYLIKSYKASNQVQLPWKRHENKQNNNL